MESTVEALRCLLTGCGVEGTDNVLCYFLGCCGVENTLCLRVDCGSVEDNAISK